MIVFSEVKRGGGVYLKKEASRTRAVTRRTAVSHATKTPFPPDGTSYGTTTLWKPVAGSSRYSASLWSQRIRWSAGGALSPTHDGGCPAWCGHRRTTSCAFCGRTNFGVARRTQPRGVEGSEVK